AYQAAWLKHNYPAEFMAAVLTNGKGFYAPLVYVLECHRLGIPLLPPSVNEPGPAFSVIDTPFNDSDSARNSPGPFPLTPALSPGERERHHPPFDQCQAPRFFERQDTILPLPGVEGRGGGEGAIQSPAA